jgi:PAS domain S-box-containing protein
MPAPSDSDHLIRRMLESLPLIGFIHSADAVTTLYLSPQWFRYTGTDPAAADLAQEWARSIHPADLELLNAAFAPALQRAEPWTGEFRLRRYDGQYRWHRSSVVPDFAPATGALLRWFGTTTDVHEQHELEERLRASEEELRVQAESIPQQVWTAHADGTWNFYNHRMAAYLGEPMDQRGPENWLDHVHPDDRATALARWEVAQASGRYYEAEFRLRRYDGQYRWFLAQAQARHGGQQPGLRWYGTNTDIHEQRSLQEQLGRSVEQFRFMAESVPQILWTARPDGWLDYYNQRWFDYTGLSAAESEGHGRERVLHPDDLPLYFQNWNHSLRTTEAYEVEYRFRRADGVYRWHLGRAEALKDASGQVLKWFGTCTDIDDFKRAQQHLEQRNAQLVRTNEDLDNFVYTASHDLKQPIHNMAGIFEELTRTAYFRDPDAIKLITYFERALQQIYDTIDDLGAIVQVQRQQGEVPAEAVDLAQLTDEIIHSVQDRVRATGATFELDFDTCPALDFVRPNLQSILYNLLSNSLKYAAPGRTPRIRVACGPNPVTGRPVLTVQDNGLGIDLERFGPQLFQLFRRFHPDIEGTGVGLYLVNRIVQTVGGRLEVDSTVDEGTTFRLFL